MAGLSTHSNRIAGRTTSNDFKRQICLMAVDSDELAAIDFIMPDGQIRVVGIDFDFRFGVGVLGAVVRHRDQHGRLSGLHAFLERVVQVTDGCGLFGRLLVPGPQD